MNQLIDCYKRICHLFQTYKMAVILFIFLAIILGLVTPFNSGETPPMLLAKEILVGKPYLPQKIDWIEMLEWEGHHYIAYPPMVTFMVLPYVLIGGQYLGGAIINSIMIFGSSILLFLLVKQLQGIRQWSSLAAIAYILGTTNLHSAHNGSVWLFMHSQGNFFLLLSLWLFISKRAYFGAGLSFAIAFQIRYVIILGISIFPIYAFYSFQSLPTISNWRRFLLGILPPCLITWAFQWWTLGNPFLSPYTIAWQQWGMTGVTFSFEYLSRNFQIYFLEMPKLLKEFPYLQFNLGGQAMWVISPFLLGVLFLNFRQRFVWAFLPAAIGMVIAYLFYWYTGATQYGTRYIQDIFPILIPLAFAGFSYKNLLAKNLLLVLVLISCLINIYAVMFSLKTTWN
ncbi:hypothetical protein Pse7429DRAFT_1664 [Pseudanabaena biceps PCC 7429]|uniref:Glycosyltransferase RgtA/B/C/D-like domain-containing protein n=2 Tax=Pseudanabaena TaxID=1152 RepID=L8N211_9CYAN|nr:hypothetical protein Pse7429DRAFT_1664 [Pseudanabaena biceps PCC 7429]